MSNIYISVPNPVVICIEKAENFVREGEIYHPYAREAIRFENMEQGVREIEALYNEFNFPFPGTMVRSFFPKHETKRTNQQNILERPRVWSDEELMQKRGKVATFLIQTRQRQNSCWNGSVSYLEEGTTETFRSIIELMRYIERCMQMEGRSFV